MKKIYQLVVKERLRNKIKVFNYEDKETFKQMLKISEESNLITIITTNIAYK